MLSGIDVMFALPRSGPSSAQRVRDVGEPRAIITEAGMSSTDHHSEYLARALDALTSEGHERVDELLDQLAEVVGDHEAVARFAAARKAEADAGRMDASAAVTPGRALSPQVTPPADHTARAPVFTRR